MAGLGPVEYVCSSAAEAEQCDGRINITPKGEHCAGELGYLQDNAGECMVIAGAASMDV